MAARHIPQRMCLACRDRQPKSELIRVVVRGNQLQVDPQASELGRGAYVHKRSECIDLAESRRMFAKALRVANIDSRSIESIREFNNSTTVEPKPTGVKMSAVLGTHA